MELQEKRILNIGLACLDMVMMCKSYPEEDSDQRCISQRWQRGGNASNNCTIMAEYGYPCEYFGTMSKDLGGQFLKNNLESFGICIENCIYYENCESPTSVILINSLNGSRTIVHSNRNLPEVTVEQFKVLDLKKYKWIHFEARPSSVERIKSMIEYIDEWNKQKISEKIIVSVELEKAKPHFEELLGYADVVFISKDFARMSGYTNMATAAENLCGKLKPGSLLVCPWGDQGACAKSQNGPTIISAAFPPEKLIDTLAAGDTFIATVIMCLSEGKTVKESIQLGCKVAGAKCGMEGIRGVKSLVPLL